MKNTDLNGSCCVRCKLFRNKNIFCLIYISLWFVIYKLLGGKLYLYFKEFESKSPKNKEKAFCQIGEPARDAHKPNYSLCAPACAGPLWVRVRYSRPGGGDLRVGVGAGVWAGRLLPSPPPSRPLLPQHLRIYRTYRQHALTNNRIFHSICSSTQKHHFFYLSVFRILIGPKNM
jgi:hypothetical protein